MRARLRLLLCTADIAYLGRPGLDFESRLLYKPDAAALLEKELRAPKYQCAVMAMGTNTDPYQPVERELEITRAS